MSTLLEHLLDGQELVSKHDDLSANETSMVNEIPPATEPPPTNETPSANEAPSVSETPSADELPPVDETLGPHPSDSSERSPHTAASTPPRSAFDASTESARPRESQKDPAPQFSTVFPTPMDGSPSSVSSPIIFVGFGTGANSLLHLAVSSRLSASFPARNVGGGRISSGGVVTSGAGHARGSCSDGGGESRSPLALALRRSALHVGGLVLVNGFVSLEKQASKVRGPFF